MNFVRAFELYERRWGIEVIFKECRGYLGLGKCQSRSYNAQIADTTLCFMMYQMLSLAKRFSEYETLGALFRSERDRLQVLTLCRGYLGLGKCQSRSYNAQIADTTLCFMMYQMLSLAKRFSEYETLGALFRSERDRLQVLTLWSRTLEEVRHLLEVLSRETGVDLLACLSTVAAWQTARTANGRLFHKGLGTSFVRFGQLCHARFGLNIF